MNLRLSGLHFAVCSALSLSVSPVIASEQSNQTAKDDQKIVITGSHIRRINDQKASPLVEYDADAIRRSGATSLSEVLQTTVLGNGDMLNNQQTGGFTPGAASFNLRGLRADRTLILLNGKRLPSYPFAGNGNVAFVDLNFIPLAEVERIVVLKDGASSVYGSDAIAGVVNIITHRDYDGHLVTLKSSRSSASAWSNDQLSYLGGYSSEDSDLVVTAEYQHSDPLKGENLEMASQLDVSEVSSFSFPGTWITLNPATNNLLATPAIGCARNETAADLGIDSEGAFCVQDWAADRQLSPENTRASLSAAWSQYMGDSTLIIDFAANRNKTFSDVPFGFVGHDFLIQASDPNNPLGEIMLLRRGITETGLQSIETLSNNCRASVTLEGFIGAYDYQASVNHGLTRVDETYLDGWMTLASRDALFAEIDAGNINPFTTIPSDILAGYTQSFDHKGKSDETGAAFNLSGEVGELDGGVIMMATGFEYRQESISDDSDAEILDGQVAGLGASKASGDRNVAALYAEFNLPFSDVFELNASMRFDNYSDFGSRFTPKLAAKYQVSDDFVLRGSWGNGFRAPNLFELNSSANGMVGSIPFVSQGNPDLNAETSESFNLGLAYSFNDDLLVTLDGWQIQVDDMISNLGVAAILTTLDENGNLLYDDYIVLNPDQSINHIVDPYVNINSQQSSGVDLTLQWKIVDGISWNMNWSHLSSLTRDNNGSGDIQVAGEYLFPKNRINGALVYQSGDWKQELSAYHIDAHGSVAETGSYNKLNYQLHYQFDNLEFILHVNNLTDKKPPQNEFLTWPHYEQRMYSALGRSLGVEFRYPF